MTDISSPPMLPAPGRRGTLTAKVAACVLVACTAWPLASQAQSYNEGSDTSTPGPVRLRQPATALGAEEPNTADTANGASTGKAAQRNGRGANGQPVQPPYRLGEFERFVNGLANIKLPPEDPSEALPSSSTLGPRRDEPVDPIPPNAIRRLGAELMTVPQDEAPSATQVPADYLLAPGDEVQLTIWGSVDADLRLVVDRSGRIGIPRVGSIMVAGIRYGDLNSLISQRVSQVFRDFQLSTALGKLRGIRVYVTGFTARPGSYTVSSLSTVVSALMRAGGPSAAGSFRNIELRRAGKLLATFDLYDLLLKGDKSADRILQSEDVVHIGPVGPQIALIGSVNRAAVFELRPSETVGDVLTMAGGFTAVADRNRLTVQRIDERNDIGVRQLALPVDLARAPTNGDVMRAFSAVESALSTQKQNRRVRIEGEVAMPGEYVLAAGSTISTALQTAGGITTKAFIFGTDLSRESVRQTQQANYERALRDLETEFARKSANQRALTADEATAQSLRGADATRLIERLRAVKPTGRVVLQLPPEASQLPDLVLEDGDRINVPALPSSVGIFGSVFSSGSYLYQSGRQVTDYLHDAGGPSSGADEKAIFVIRANGSVISSRQRGSGWWGWGANLKGVPAIAGDTIFVPEELNQTTFTQEAKEWTQILYQFGIGAAALVTLRNN